MYTVYTDVEMTRRKRMVFILDEQSTVLWTGRSFLAALQWLHEAGQTEARIEGQEPAAAFEIIIRPE